jgi:serine/threonine protein kinase
MEISWKHYKIEKNPIGVGSFSKVYKAFDTHSHSSVAIKKIPFDTFSDVLKKRVHSELFILQTVRHPNIIQFIDFEFVKNNLYVIFEFCEENISNYIGKITNEEQLKRLFQGIIDGISYLHSNQIIHRDLKPENILMKDGVPKICDFGFSTIIKDSRRLNATICGTPLYMSPENLEFESHTKTTDIWSMGILFYTVAYGMHPFKESNSIQEYKKRIRTPIIYPTIPFSSAFVELLKYILVIDKTRRPSIEAVAMHPWFKSTTTYEIVSDYFSPSIASSTQPIEISNYKRKESFLHNSIEFLRRSFHGFSI